MSKAGEISDRHSAFSEDSVFVRQFASQNINKITSFSARSLLLLNRAVKRPPDRPA